MINYQEFVASEKSMLIAPAGYGKTHTIAECLKHTKDKGIQLILTHTHAGVASIKQKIKKEGISSSDYCVETISSFTQKYVLAFYSGSDIPPQTKTKEYFKFIGDEVINIFNSQLVKEIVSNTYGGLFIDEYQDCTVQQHALVLKLSEVLPTHILGDPMQGIFNFGGQSIVNLDDPEQMQGFSDHREELTVPYRWKETNEPLGIDLARLRHDLANTGQIDFRNYPSIEHHKCDEALTSKPKEIFRILAKEKNVLIIDPISTNINSRKKLVQRLANIPRLIESIDDRDFYNTAQKIDKLLLDPSIKIKGLCDLLFNKTEVNKWLNENDVKRKVNEDDKKRAELLKIKLHQFNESRSPQDLAEFIKSIDKLPGIKCYRKELLESLCTSLSNAGEQKTSIVEAMVEERNRTRRVGRRVYGRCIGTTLLTKGLEFDVVVVVDAHKFTCPKNLYVALTRGSRRLIVFSQATVIQT